MKVEGEAAELAVVLFPEGLIPLILGLTMDVWKGLARPKPTDGETKITRVLTRAMQKEKRRRGLPFSIRSHAEEHENLDEASGTEFSEIDILLQHGDDERCYFAFEAKKLNSTTKSGNPDTGSTRYAGKPGMGAFVDGTYACYQNHAGMIGYVMDGDCPKAKRRVKRSVKNQAAQLRMTPPCELKSLPYFPGNDDVFETQHLLDRGKFSIFHVLLGAV